MLDKEITFDRFIRGAILLGVFVLLGMLINRLSNVLWPFFLAWLLAYMMYPLVHFLQYKCRLRNRVLCIFLSLLLVISAIAAALAVILPPTISEFSRLMGFVSTFMQGTLIDTGIAGEALQFVQRYLDEKTIMNIVQQGSFVDTVQNLMTELWLFITGTIDFALGLLGMLIILLYMFFILMDYETISEKWITLIPKDRRPFAHGVIEDVKHGMNAYFRGQSLVAFCVGVLFSIGFLIIDFPMAIGLGMFIGLLNLVPYLQMLGFVPAVLLALLKAADTGQNFWAIMAMVLAVFAVVQVIQDMYLTPRIMGKVMGLNPAIILLSLSVWGSLLGFVGLIIALPLTTLVISYYKRFILREN